MIRYLILAILLLATVAEGASIPLVRYGSNTPVYLKNGAGILVSNDGTVTATGIAAAIKGQYAAGTAYVAGDIVGYNGQSWVAKQATTGNQPVEGPNWTLFADKGPTGTAGVSPEIHSVFDAPAADLGKDGDWAFDTSVEAKVFKRAAGTWTLVNSVRGPAGANGSDGAPGANGLGISAGSDGTYGWFTNTNTSGYTECAAGRYGFNWVNGVRYTCENGVNSIDTGGAQSTSDLTDWPSVVSVAELTHLDGTTSNVQAQINNIASGSTGRVSVPLYSNSTCSLNQWAVDGSFYYVCTASNTWDRIALSAWNNPSGAAPLVLFASQSTLSPSQVGVNDITDRARVGAIIDSATPHNVRQLKVYVRAITDGGGLAGKSYVAKLYALDGSKTLSTLLATSTNTVSGAGILASSWLSFDFPTTALAQMNAWVIEEASGAAPDAANFIMIGYNTADTDSTYNHYATWRTNGTLFAEQPTRDLRYELYE